MDERVINKLAVKLKEILSLKPLHAYEWPMPTHCPIDIKDCQSTYEQNVRLKEKFQEVIAKDQTLKSHYWAIQEWGGIRSFKKNERNDERIRAFLKELPEGALTKDSFGCISSLSKVASFIYPQEYVIYDSRVIYSLNWLLFNYCDELRLFPQPASRSSALAKYDLGTIFRLTGAEVDYFDDGKAYHAYCTLINAIAANSEFGMNYPAYMIEMLLFSIPAEDQWIMRDIKRLASIKFAA